MNEAEHPAWLTYTVAVAKLPFLLLGYLLKHRRVLLVAIIFTFGFLVYRTLNSQDLPATAIEIPYWQQMEPDKSLAPKVIQTLSPDRVYYVADYSEEGGVIILKDYYFFQGDSWQKGASELYLERDKYFDILIYAR